MSPRLKIIRFFLGFVGIILFLSLFFGLLLPGLDRYGSTQEEQNRIFTGDDLLKNPILVWTHAIDINAEPQKVWPWIIQIGDTRGGFYSFTCIENLIARESLYQNADQIHAEWQDPKPGESIISNFLLIKSIQPGQSMLTATNDPTLGWTWLWQVEPQADQKTRLLIRMRIQIPAEMNSPLLISLMDLGAFVMEKGMIDGIKSRAEGKIPPSYFETSGIVVWISVFLLGLAAAVLFINRKKWLLPLITGFLSVIILIFFTFVQPEMWIRFLCVAALCACLLWVERRS